MLHTRIDIIRAAWCSTLGLVLGSSCGPSKESTVGLSDTTATTSSTTTSSTTTSSTTTSSTTGVAPTSGPLDTTLATGSTSSTSTTGAPDSDTTTGGTPIGPPTCEDPEPVLQFDDSPSGFMRCSNGVVHREEALTCLLRPVNPGCAEFPGAECVTHEDCGPLGACNSCQCEPTCATDSDCAADQICLCGQGFEGSPYCIPTLCKTDADCAGSLCAGAVRSEPCVGNIVTLGCHGPASECHVNTDCPAWEGNFLLMTAICTPEPNFVCSFDDAGAACPGRPFIVDEHARMAPAITRDDWSATITAVAAADLDPAQRARLGAHWVASGLAEHASVASFARFTLQLLAVGAPAALVDAAQRAMGDEVQHARVCFALARAHGEPSTGPGALDVRDAMTGGAELATVTAAVLREACIGETLSALEAREASERAVDPCLRALLGQIADDEARHAELGWRFLAWALERADPSTLAQLTAQLAEVRDASHSAVVLTDDATLEPHGLLATSTRHELRRRALDQLILPIAQALLRPVAVAA